MEEQALDATLHHVLDPVLQQTPEPDAASQPETPASATPDIPTSGRRPAKRARKSAAPVDTRRKEANRLAAERSRGRQQEKVVALEVAIQSLGDENLRLREEIARLESGTADANPMSLDLLDTPAADDDHSRTLLNALLSAPASATAQPAPADEMWLDPSGELNENWMMGMDDLFPGVDASGRLGELANIAAGQGGDASAFTVSAQDAAVLNDAISASNAQAAATPNSNEVARRPIQPPTAPLTLRSSTAAVALNTEMEKAIRDDLLQTKDAIARIQREIDFYRGQADPAVEDTAVVMTTLSGDILRANDEEVASKIDQVEAQISEAKEEADVLRVVISRTRDARYEEANKLSAVVNELRALGMDGGERERERITGVLRALRGHITAVIANPGGSDGNGFTPFSSATARRKRGRPPKNPVLAKYGVSFLSPPGSDGSGDSGSELPDTPITRPRGNNLHRRSRLAQELRLSPEPSSQVGRSNAAGSMEEQGETSQAAHAHAHDEYLLSHLTDAVHGARDGSMSLDTSFAAFLPPSPDSNSHPGHHHDSLDGTLVHVPGDTGNGTNETSNALSRFRRGPSGSCDICSRTQTSVWRKLTFEGEELRVCNACGLYYTKFGVPRPAELWGDGRTVKKRKASEGKSRRKRKSSKFAHEHEHEHEYSTGQVETEVDMTGAELANGSHDLDSTAGGPDDHAHSLNDVGRAVQNMFAAAAVGEEHGSN